MTEVDIAVKKVMGLEAECRRGCSGNPCIHIDPIRAEFNRLYYAGLREGLRQYAWWKDGLEYVGSCGTTLAAALSHVDAKEKRENDHG